MSFQVPVSLSADLPFADLFLTRGEQDLPLGVDHGLKEPLAKDVGVLGVRGVLVGDWNRRRCFLGLGSLSGSHSSSLESKL